MIEDQQGEMGLVQILLAAALMIGVLGATLAVFSSAERLNRDANERSEAQDRGRVAVDRLAAQLRNLASPTADDPHAIDHATPYDLVFVTVDRLAPSTEQLNATNVMRVRYCLGTSDPSRLYRQEQRWTSQETPAAPPVTGCPEAESSAGWSATSVVAESVVNRNEGQDRAAFVYNAAATTDISSIHAQLYVDSDTSHAPSETVLSSGVFLRNQNRRPVAGFTADTTVSGKIVLNGAVSSDPEGDPLTYVWFDGEIKVGEGIRFDYTVTPGTTHAIQLKVFDLAGLEGESTIQTVEVPA